MDIKNKPTDEMLEELLRANDIEAYFKENSAYFIDYTVAEYLCFLCERLGLRRADVIKKAELNEIYGYQIFAGKRVPSRDKLLCLAVGMGLDLSGTDKLMKTAGYAVLYPKSKRDSVIISAVSRGLSVMEINSLLYAAGEQTL